MTSVSLPDLSTVLNPEQHRAATTLDGPLLVLAGAGSGKTRVLVHRIAYILAERRALPWQILAVTFTNKAAAEMRERLEALVGPPAREAWIGTFHALSARMLRIEGHRLGYRGSFSIYDADDSRRLLKTIMKSMGIDPSGHGVNAQTVGSEIDKAKNAGLGPRAFAERVGELDAPPRKIAKAVYFRYQDALRAANAMDFGDLVMLSTELLTHHPAVHERFGKRFRYVMVDEFQDTNQVQYAFLRALTKDRDNLMVVGDDDQSIYRWRGAEVAHILGFEDTYPDAEVVRLEQNYRSTGNILAAANAVIAQNRRRHGKTLFTGSGPGAKVGVALLDEAYAEADLVARRIQASIDDGREPFEHAILYRMNAQSRLLEETLRRARIPYRLLGGTGFFDRMEVKDVLAYLRLIVNPASRGDFERIVNVPGRGIGAKTIEKLREAGEAAGRSGALALGLDDAALKGAGIGKAAIEKLRAFRGLLEELQQISLTLSATAVAEAVIERTDYFAHLDKDPASADDRKANVGELLSSIAEHEEWAILSRAEDAEEPALGIAGAKTPLEAFLDEAALASGERAAGDEDGVALLTLHSAKGLEFPIVFIAGLEEKTFPAARAVESGDEAAIEEERRLCYVGMTRAMEALYLTAARRRVIFGREELRLPSRFLGELPDEHVAGIPGAAPSPGTRYGFRGLDERGAGGADPLAPVDGHDDDPFERSEPVYRVPSGQPRAGGRVRHRTFGDGDVSRVEGDGAKARVHVRFDDGKEKTVIARFLDVL
mgnify:CR=1 FL=1